MMKTRCRAIAGVLLSIAATVDGSRAGTLADFLARGEFDGELRAYYFMRDYGAATVPNASALSLSGLFDYQTPRFLGGFSAGAGYYSASALGSHSADRARVDTTLMGARNSINALGPAYLQLRRHHLFLRGGDQTLATPWANGSDSRALPSTYRAAIGKFGPIAGLTLQAVRILRYRSRTSDGYFRDNNYFPTGWRSDANFGGVADLPSGVGGTAGALALGASYRLRRFAANLWYYDFRDFARMTYDADELRFAPVGRFTPYAGVQIVREWYGTNAFGRTGTRLFGQPGAASDNLTWGLKLGVESDATYLAASYNRIRRQGARAFGGGALISPYTAGDATDPLFTTSMSRGLVELGPGSAWRLAASTFALSHRLQFIAAIAQYRTLFNGNDALVYFDAIYLPQMGLKGLTLRDRLEIGNGRVNPGHRQFLYDRVQLTYRF